MTASLEDIKTLDLEEWLTLNTAASPTKLKPGQTPDMKNVWVDEKPGSIITAPGFVKVGEVPSGNPCSFAINFFKTSAGTQTFVVSDNATVWTTIDFQAFTPIITSLSDSFQLRGKVIRDKLWLTNGFDSVRTFDGVTVSVLDGTGGTPNVPKGRYLDYHDERVWVYHFPSQRSQAAFSALTDSSGNIITPDDPSAWPSSNTLQVSEGDADYGTGLLVYRGYLHFFKQYSIWRLAGYDEYTYTRVKTRSSTGTRFAESVQILDSLVHFIGIDGMYVFDGEDSDRISDIIDPSTASQTAFGFNGLQQPNQNGKFWQVSDSVDWVTGTLPDNMAIDDDIHAIPKDNTQSDFAAGVTLTNISTSELPGSIKLSRTNDGSGRALDGPSLTGAFFDGGSGAPVVFGNPQWLIDGSNSRLAGLGAPTNSLMVVNFDSPTVVGGVILRNVQADAHLTAVVRINTGTTQTNGGSQGTWVNVGTFDFAAGGGAGIGTDITILFVPQSAVQVSIFLPFGGGTFLLSEIEVYKPSFNLTGKFVSRSLDLGAAWITDSPTLLTVGAAEPSGSSLTYFTQTSDDGITWDAEASFIPGTHSSLNSTKRRYLRWGANFVSNGLVSPTIDYVFLPSVYLSEIHDTGGDIFSWGPFAAEYYPSDGVKFYYRGATSIVGVDSASWNLIVPGGSLSFSVLFRYIQFRVEFLYAYQNIVTRVDAITINWVSGTAGQPSVLQNVASVYWRNRYWLSAAGPGASANDTILVRGKKTFASPWMLKDWEILAFTRFQDSLYGCSSIDGSIYKLDTGYSKASVAMDSYFETGDFIFGGFIIELIEILVEVERSGSWTMNIGVSMDRGLSFADRQIDLTPNGYDVSFIKKINFNLKGDRFRLRFRTNGIDTPFQVHRCLVFYRLKPERGSIIGEAPTFD